jgi:glutamate-1-semialdehyde 2,1-aminomutase
MIINNSKRLFEEASLHIPGGVNSPVRAFGQVGGNPIFMKSAEGAYLIDEDDNKYIDYINSWGPMILGHNNQKVVDAVQKQAGKAFSFGTPTKLETEIAKLIKEMVPNIELVRFVNSGTEACMSAVRLARGYTKKSKIIKFEGHYHGHADMFLKKAGSGVATFDIKQVGGVPLNVTDDTLIISFNDFEEFDKVVSENKNDIAAIILEPVAGNMGCVPPVKGFLEHIRKKCTENNIVLIFDEVMTGFRLAKGGAQEKLDVWADLVTFGKVIGGGLPVGAFGGKKEIMSCIAPLGNVYQAGTLSGNPLAMSAGFTTLSELNSNKNIYSELENKGKFLAKNINDVFQNKNFDFTINQLGSMISVHFCKNNVIDFKTASAGNNQIFKKFFHHMLKNGVYLPPSAYESWFLSISLSDKDLMQTINACKDFSA